MTRKPSFANLRATPPVAAAPVPPEAPRPAPPASRTGRKQIAGFFTPDMRWRCTCLPGGRTAACRR